MKKGKGLKSILTSAVLGSLAVLTSGSAKSSDLIIPVNADNDFETNETKNLKPRLLYKLDLSNPDNNQAYMHTSHRSHYSHASHRSHYSHYSSYRI